jgi:hypothetical protein
MTTAPRPSLGILGCLLLAACCAQGTTFTDDFANGIDPLYWEVVTDQPLYVVDGAAGEVRISKPLGGEYRFQYAGLNFLSDLTGDFDVSVAFREAQIDRLQGTPGNQVQLNLGFGNVVLCVVRSDEVDWGDNHHVWLNPPAAWQGAAVDNSTAGTMRVRRHGSHVEAFIHGSLFWEADVNAEPLTYLAIVLQNNGTIDPTSVVFDDFSVTADAITAVGDAPVGTRVAFAPPWPNPVAQGTQLSFNLGAAQPVELSLYDLAGRHVRTLLTGAFAAGPHAVAWDGTDDTGRRVAAGAYIWRLVTPQEVQTRKIAVAR